MVIQDQGTLIQCVNEIQKRHRKSQNAIGYACSIVMWSKKGQIYVTDMYPSPDISKLYN